MLLNELVDGVAIKSASGSGLSQAVSGLAFDSREVKSGFVFFALAGQDVDGNDFVDAAVEAGAVAIVSEQPYPASHEVAWLQVQDARYTMGRMAANFYGHPSLHYPVVGVTGTNGKTTTSFLIHHIFEKSLHRAGLIGTIHYSSGDGLVPASHTTPESLVLQGLLSDMLENSCRAVAMEVSSHGIVQHRVEGVHFDAAIFTNLSQDHLDFHRSMDAYFEAKAGLFDQMDRDGTKQGTAIVNIDDIYGERLLKRSFTRLKTYSFGRNANADFRIENERSTFNGSQFKLSFKSRSFLVNTPLIGAFNIANAAAAIAGAYAAGLNLREIIQSMADAPQVPGRLEAVQGMQTNYRVFVDYAHTPDALENVLRTLRGLDPARIITVFGCGGDRDMTKRAPMARMAEEGSDYCLLTADNPRTEDPAQILADAEKGFTRDGRYEVIDDRSAAIGKAVEMAGERDIVLVAGKGHETYQEINGIRHDFDDRKIALAAMRRKADPQKKAFSPEGPQS